jgi:sugar phosphate isomerase/epimerase
MHVHLSDNNGKVHGDLPPGRGTAPLREYLKVLKGLGFNGAVTIELEFSPEPAKIREWVKEAYEVSAGMMKELKIRG